ncbi:MAG: PP2C family protein-serine/threonine phosphatase [Phycisphaeraceae bacterium]
MSAALTQPVLEPSPHQVQCLEVWGGSEAVAAPIIVPGIEAWVYSQPFGGAQAGGDLHYVSSCFTGRVARFVVADVAGHGQNVGALAMTLRKLMRKHINYLDQTGLARVLNREFAALNQQGRFATALLISYFAVTRHLIVCNAGHPRPMWYRARQGEWSILEHDTPHRSDSPNNLPLGVIEPTDYVQFAVRLDPDDLLLLYTDSMTEAKAGGDGEQLGEAGLLRLLEELTPTETGSPRALCEGVLRGVAAHRGDAPADDDQTVVALRHTATGAPHKRIRGAIRQMAALLGLAGD